MKVKVVGQKTNCKIMVKIRRRNRLGIALEIEEYSCD
jgi:hypothetical protein